MSKKAYEKLCKEVKKLTGEDVAARSAYNSGGFETDLHVIESDKGGSVAVRTPNGYRHVKGFIFAGLALDHGFKLVGGRYVYEGGDEEADDKSERDSDEDPKLSKDRK